MHIKQLEVDNFKSIAEPVTIPFLKGFTTVTGPNGSGKSAIIDSILFALGLSTSRTLRVEKVAHLISTYTKRNEAFVKVTFGADTPDEEEFSVSRRLKKSSQGYNSIYAMNDKTCTLTEIHSKLEQYNITPNSYNVIMQGDVLSIISCSANERREVIDEIAGVTDFNTKIKQAQEQLAIVEGRVQNSNIVKASVDEQLEQLAAEKEEALKYKALKEEKQSYESQITIVKYFDIKRALEKAHENIIEENKKQKEKQDAQKTLLEEIKQVRKKFDELVAMIKEKGEDKQLEVKRIIEELKGSIKSKENSITFNERNIQSNLKLIENAKNGIEQAKQKIEDFKKDIEAQNTQIETTRQQKLKYETELQKMLQDLAGLNESAEEFIKKRTDLRSQLEKAKDEELDIEKEKLPLETKLENLKKNIDDAKDKLKNLTEFKENFISEQDRLQVQCEELNKELEDYRNLQQKLMNDAEKYRSEIGDLTHDLKIATQKVYSLRANKAAYENLKLGHEIDVLMNSRLRGVHAPLAKLGTVDKEYSLALEVAMGGRMKFVVVDDDDVARIGVETLKSANAGRVTFLPLNKLRSAPTKLKLPNDSGVIDFAINLIDFDEQYIDAFYLALGETLVVEDYATAQKLMGRYRLVTLTGEVFEKSGSITGGSRKSVGIQFGQNEDEELVAYTKKMEELEQKIAGIEIKQQEVVTQQDNLRKTYSQTTTAYSEAKAELNNLNKAAAENEKIFVENTEFVKNTEPEIAVIEKKLDELELKHVDINNQILVLEEEVAKIESQISEDELNKLKEVTGETEKAIADCDKSMASCLNEIDKIKNNINFQEDIFIKTKEEQIKKQLQDNITFEQEKATFSLEIEELNKNITEQEEQIKELSESLKGLQEERDNYNTKIVELETQKNINEHELEQIAEKVESYKARRRELNPELEKAKNEIETGGMEIAQLKPTEISIDELNSKITKLQTKIDALGDVNMRAITSYDEVKTRQDELIQRIETLSTERLQILERMNGYEDLKKQTFMKAYTNISENFKDIFQKLSEGEGKLILENPDMPFHGGLTIEARPRDKATKLRLEGLSGGEKTLTALSFFLAIQKYLPAPFYYFDEVDGNLDGWNVEKVAEMIKKQSENTQFVVVSHRPPMVQSANRTIGVTQKEKGKTSVTGIKLRD